MSDVESRATDNDSGATNTNREIEARLAKLKARRATSAPSPSDATPRQRATTRKRASDSKTASESAPARDRGGAGIKHRAWRTLRVVATGLVAVTIVAASTAFAVARYREAGGPAPADPRGMVSMPSARYTVGTASGRHDELPAQVVMLPAFAIDRHAVSNDAYAQYLRGHTNGAVPAGWSGRFAPTGTEHVSVAGVALRAASDYCNALGKRLPSEFEWEAAARGSALVDALSGPAEWIGTPAVPTPDVYAVQRGGISVSKAYPTTASSRTVVDRGTLRGGGFRCAADAIASGFADDLTTPNPLWPTSNGPDTALGFVPGVGFGVAVHAPRERVSVPMGLDAADANVELRVQLDGTATTASVEYGLLLRSSDRGAYAFVLAPARGQWRFLHVNGKRRTVVASGRPGSLGGSVAPDALRVEMHGARLDLFVNDQLVRSVLDRRYDRGDVGVWLDASGARAARIVVQHLRVSGLSLAD